MKKSTSRWLWLLPAIFAVILFIGQVATNLLVKYLDPYIGPYPVWIACVLALVVSVIVAIIGTRREDSPTTGETQSANASGDRNVAIVGNLERSTINTGDESVGTKVAGGDRVAGDKKIYINQVASAAVNSVNALHQLRAPVGDFVGREEEVKTLIDALRRGRRASITGISGMGGIGKTELALFVAGHLKGDYPDAQFFINLQGTDVNPRSPEEILAICIRAFLGPEAKLPDDLEQLSQYYRSQLSGKRVLLLLDNAADSVQVQPLLPPPGSALLVTSRRVVTLPGMTPLTLNPLTNKEARELLLDIAPRAEPAADEICRLCGYLPLAIRAAGSLLAVTADLDPSTYVTQLNDERGRLERIGTEGIEIGVAASFNLSYERLMPETARVFRSLAVFPSTFDTSAEEAVCDDAEHAQLTDLVRRSLVLFDSSTRRYRLHDLVRVFTDSKLSAEERAIGHKRHATHYRNVLASADDLFLKGGEVLARGLALFDLEWSNIQTGHAWVVTQGLNTDKNAAQLSMVYPDVGINVLGLRLHTREFIRWQEIAIAAARHLKDREAEGHRLGNLGVAYSDLGENERAIQFQEQALIIFRELGDRRGEAITLGNLGTSYQELAETQRAIEFYEQELTIVREIGYRRGEGSALGNLGIAHRRLGETELAIHFNKQQLTIVRELGDRRGEANALGNLGIVYRELGEAELAIHFYEQALQIDRMLGDRRGEGIELWNMSLALYHLGKRFQAIELAEQSLAIFEQIEDRRTSNVRAKLAAWHEESSSN